MPRLYHPELDRYLDVEHPKTAAVHRRSGWQDLDLQPEVETVADEVGDDEDTDLEGDD